MAGDTHFAECTENGRAPCTEEHVERWYVDAAGVRVISAYLSPIMLHATNPPSRTLPRSHESFLPILLHLPPSSCLHATNSLAHSHARHVCPAPESSITPPPSSIRFSPHYTVNEQAPFPLHQTARRPRQPRATTIAPLVHEATPFRAAQMSPFPPPQTSAGQRGATRLCRGEVGGARLGGPEALLSSCLRQIEYSRLGAEAKRHFRLAPELSYGVHRAPNRRHIRHLRRPELLRPHPPGIRMCARRLPAGCLRTSAATSRAPASRTLLFLFCCFRL